MKRVEQMQTDRPTKQLPLQAGKCSCTMFNKTMKTFTNIT